MNFTRESVFISALRGFLKAFAVVLGIALGLVVLLVGIGSLSSSNLKSADKSELKIAADPQWSRKPLADTSPVILKINIDGVIGIGRTKLKTEKFKTLLLDSREGVLANNRVKAIILHVNSPGGTVTDSAGIYELLQTYKEKYKIPIYAFVDGICASGGMYIACSADKIYASSESIIGSVGVRLGPVFNFSDTMDKVGVKSLTLTKGKDKDALNPFRPWKEGEDQAIQNIVDASYEQFITLVTTVRKNLNREKLVNEYGANIFKATLAQEYGYIDDGNATYDQALTALAHNAGLEEGKYQVIEIEPYRSVLADLADNDSAIWRGKLTHVFPTGAYTTTEMSGQLLYLYQP